MAKFRFMVAGRGPKGIEVHADLLDEAWTKLRNAETLEGHRANLAALVIGDPVRFDDVAEPVKSVSIGDVVATEYSAPTPMTQEAAANGGSA